MFDNKTIALTGDSSPVVLGAGIPESAHAGLGAAINEARQVVAGVVDFSRRALLDMMKITARVLDIVADTEGLSKDAAFTAIDQATPGVTKSALDKWGQSVKRLRDAGLTDPDTWTAGAASAAYVLTGTGYGPAKKALTGIAVEDPDGFVEAVAEAINSNPREVKAPAVEGTTVATIEGAAQTAEAFLASVTEALDALPADQIDQARKGLKAIANGYKRTPVEV
jgi:hypothetical protein